MGKDGLDCKCDHLSLPYAAEDHESTLSTLTVPCSFPTSILAGQELSGLQDGHLGPNISMADYVTLNRSCHLTEPHVLFYTKHRKGDGEMAQSMKYLMHKHESLSLDPAYHPHKRTAHRPATPMVRRQRQTAWGLLASQSRPIWELKLSA